MSKIKKIIKLVLTSSVLLCIIPVLIILAYYTYQYVSSHATKYCPLSHKFNSYMACSVKSNQNGRILVSHSNADTGEQQLSIHEKGKTIWIMHPEKYDSTWNPRMPHKIRLDPDSKDSIIVNNIKLPIKIIRIDE